MPALAEFVQFAAVMILGVLTLAAAQPPRSRGYQLKPTGRPKSPPPPGASAGHNTGRRA